MYSIRSEWGILRPHRPRTIDSVAFVQKRIVIYFIQMHQCRLRMTTVDSHTWCRFISDRPFQWMMDKYSVVRLFKSLDIHIHIYEGGFASVCTVPKSIYIYRTSCELSHCRLIVVWSLYFAVLSRPLPFKTNLPATLSDPCENARDACFWAFISYSSLICPCLLSQNTVWGRWGIYSDK